MATYSDAYSAIADLNLWFKQRDDDALVLADIPSLLPLRWTDFKDNWEFIKEDLENKLNNSFDPDLAATQLQTMTDFINSQRTAAVVVNPFDDSTILNRFYAIFDLVGVNSLELSTEEEQIIEDEKSRVEAFIRTDFEEIRDAIAKERDDLADIVGLTDADYNRIYDRSAVPEQITVTLADIELMKQLMDSIISVEFILANSFSLEPDLIDPFVLARQNANNSEIEIGNYSSGVLVRLEYGQSLQQLAGIHLGDPDKWIDIAIANGLKAPYIDEIGEKLSLLSNGDGNQINLASTDTEGESNLDKLFIGQVILLKSDTEKFSDQRIILNIKVIPISGELVLELDGEPDLNRYKINEDAHIRVFKPNTINSNFFILIPSEDPLPDSRKSEEPFFLKNAGEDEKRAKIDLALSNTADLIFTSTDDVQLSYGLDNAVQAVQLKISIQQGSLSRHRDFGLIDITGRTNQNISQLKNVLTSSIVEQIAADDRFDRIERLNIRQLLTNDDLGTAPSGFAIELSVRLAGSGRVIPISFTVSK